MLSAHEMDEERQQNAAYEYLCHLEEAKLWIESVLKETLPPTTALEENLRNGVYLAKLGNFIAPSVVPLSRIYDIFQSRYKSLGLQFRHTDNINYWIEALKSIGFPKIFLIEITDVYDKKNMPKVIYCIHALSAHLFHLGQGPVIRDLYGKIHFAKQDIDFVCNEMKKSAITIPSFQKIGHLLSNELNSDATSLHTEIIDINKAVDEESEEKLLKCLSSSTANLVQVIPEYIRQYLYTFKEVKKEKKEAAYNRSLNNTYEPDSNEELLNHSELQGHIRKVNIDCAWEDVLKSIKKKKKENLKEIIANSFGEMKDFISENTEYYVGEALALDLNQIKSNKSRDYIQTIIQNGNRNAKEHSRILEAVAKVKAAILNRSKENLLIALRTPFLKLSSEISDFASPLYLEELEADFKMSKNLTYRDIKSSIPLLNKIAKLTSAVDARDLDSTWKSLSNPEIPFMNVDPALKTQYFKTMIECRQKKLTQNMENPLLTFLDIQECISLTNIQDKTEVLIYLEDINKAVQTSNLATLKSALKGLLPNEMSNDDIPLCMHLLRKLLFQKQLNTEEELWIDDVKNMVEELKFYKKKAEEICKKLPEKIVPISNAENILKSIENYKNKVISSNNGIQTFHERSKNLNKNLNFWLVYNLTDEIPVYINPAKKIYKWSKPVENNEKLFVVSMTDLKLTVNDINILCNKNIKNNFNFAVERVIRLQAVIRGFLVRKRIQKLQQAVIVIQKWWRQRQKKIRTKKRQEPEVLENVKESSEYNLEYFKKHVDKIIKIQALWKGYWHRKNLPFKSFKVAPCSNPSLLLLRQLALSQQLNGPDYSTDLKVQAMKSCVVETIKRNQDLACRLEEIDMKIGLLVLNRMSVEVIVAENKKMQSVRINACEPKGIKAFSKEGKKLLDGYQQLFYLLQTDPNYLTRMIVSLPSRSNHVIQRCVLSLFNYGSNSRDAYLLLRLFRSALFEEVQCKFQKPVDAISGNPLVLKLAVAFARQAEGYNPLRNILGFLIEKVLNDKVFIDTNPVDIYRRWINQMETNTGKPSELPPNVTIEKALEYPEVVERLNHNLRILKSWVKCFLERLSHCVNQFPYALRFIAKLLKNALTQKFPETPERHILKIVGNLVYYQYINSAIVAPDAFYIISLPPNQHLKVEQRRNLATIAKILHSAATKKGFGEESKHLMCLNPFIIDCHEEMKKFCINCCAVSDLEEHFQITKYSEAAQIEKPRIYITLEEIKECHKLLLEVREEVAPDPLDPIHDILDDLGPPPTLATLIGCSESSENTLARSGKIQVCLDLDNKFQSPPEDPTETEKLFIKTKELITSKLNDLKGDTLSEAIKDPKHVDLATNLNKLELAGVVKSSDDYQDVLKSLINDVSHKQEYRRLQNQEINVLRIAQSRLNEKRKFYEDQLAYYEQYLTTCLSNLTVLSNRTKKKEKSIKYSGTRLREKGVLIALNGVPLNQLKNVQFEISMTPVYGIYSVQGRFMGVEVEKIDIDIQELLKLQFDGHREINLFGKARINVNLLLHLLNKKFHSRQ